MNDHGLPRRAFLGLLAGLPLAYGLPTFADDGEEDCKLPELREGGNEDPRVAPGIQRARDCGRPLLLLALPEEASARRALAKRLHALLAHDDPALRLALANLVIVVAPEPTLRELVPELPATGQAWTVDSSAQRSSAAILDADVLESAPALAEELCGPPELDPARSPAC